MDNELLLLIGPSGAGKSALADRLARAGLITAIPTWTTRPPRPDERANGSPNHRFVSEREFDELERSGAFLGVVRLPGLAHRYGLPRPATTGPIPAVVARAAFVPTLRTHFPPGRTFQVERPAGATLLSLCERATSIEEVGARLRGLEAERQAGRLVADRWFLNDATLDGLAERVAAALADRSTSTAAAA